MELFNAIHLLFNYFRLSEPLFTTKPFLHIRHLMKCCGLTTRYKCYHGEGLIIRFKYSYITNYVLCYLCCYEILMYYLIENFANNLVINSNIDVQTAICLSSFLSSSPINFSSRVSYLSTPFPLSIIKIHL